MRASSRPTSTIRRSIRCSTTCSPTTAPSLPLSRARPRSARARSSPAWATRSARCLGGNAASRASKRRRPISIMLGDPLGRPHAGSTAQRSDRSRFFMFCGGEAASRSRWPVEPFPVLPVRRERTAHLDGCVGGRRRVLRQSAAPAWIGRRVHRAVGRRACARLTIRRPVSCCASTYARSAAIIEDPRRGSALAHADDDRCGLLRQRARRRPARWRGLRAHPPPRHEASPASGVDPGRAFAGQETRRTHRRRRMRRRRWTFGAPSYRFMRRWRERRPPALLTLRQIDPLIRTPPSLYRDLIQRKTGDPA